MRILSLAPSNTEILFAIGAGADVVGCSMHCDHPAQARSLPRLTIPPDIDQVRKLSPDIVLAGPGSASFLAKLEEAGIKAESIEPRTLSEAIGSIERLGALSGNGDGGKKLIAEMMLGFYSIREDAEGASEQEWPRIAVMEWLSPRGYRVCGCRASSG